MLRLTRAQVREVDRVAIEEYGIPGIVLMENAARGAAAVALEMIRQGGEAGATIVCGGGNNGGDGLAVARHLHNRSMRVEIGLTADPERYTGDALINWRIVQAMKLSVVPATPEWIVSRAFGLVIDAVFGTGLSQPPRPGFEPIVEAVAKTQLPVLAIDLPSGLDCDTGVPLGACIRADRTVTFVAEKAGFANPQSRAFTGLVTVAEIGAPRELVDDIVSSSQGL